MRPAQAYADYQDIMTLTEDLIKAAAQSVTGGLEVDYQGQHLDFSRPFRRASMHDLVQEVTGGVLIIHQYEPLSILQFSEEARFQGCAAGICTGREHR